MSVLEIELLARVDRLERRLRAVETIHVPCCHARGPVTPGRLRQLDSSFFDDLVPTMLIDFALAHEFDTTPWDCADPLRNRCVLQHDACWRRGAELVPRV